MTEQNSALSQEEMDFKVWQKAAWEEVEQFRETAEDYFGENNPQHRLAFGNAKMRQEKLVEDLNKSLHGTLLNGM